MSYKVFDPKAVLEFECNLKHECAIHGLNWEHITTILSTQLMEEEGKVDDLFKKLEVVTRYTNDSEECLLEFMNQMLLKDATATKQIRLSKEDIRQFIWQYGHNVLEEEHFADKIVHWMGKYLSAETKEEKNNFKEKVLTLCKFLYIVRMARRKYIGGLLGEVSEKETQIPSHMISQTCFFPSP